MFHYALQGVRRYIFDFKSLNGFFIGKDMPSVCSKVGDWRSRE